MKVGYPDPALVDGVIALRPWSFDDLGCVEQASTDSRITTTTTVPARWTVAAGRAFIERQWRRVEAGESISLVIHDVDLDRAVGALAMNVRPQPGVIGLGYWVVPSARGRGLATRAARLASTWAIGPGGFARTEAWVRPENRASQSVLINAGFDLEGCLRSFLELDGTRADALVYSRIAEQGESRPVPGTGRDVRPW